MRIAPLPHRTVALGAAVTALAVALSPGLALAGSSMDEIELKAHDGLPIIGMGTVVVIISVLFEKAQHLLLRRVSTRTVPVVNALFREWALLGFVGLLFFIFTQSGALESMSVVVFGEDQPLRLTHEVQRVDMALFTALMLFLGFMLGLIHTGSRWAHRCHVAESHSSHAQKLIAEFQKLRIAQAAQRTQDSKRCCLTPAACFRRMVRRAPCRRIQGWESPASARLLVLEEQLVFSAMRARFVLREQDPGDDALNGPTSPVAIKSPTKGRRLSRFRRGSADLMFEAGTAVTERVVLSEGKDAVYRMKSMVPAFQLSTTFSMPELCQNGGRGDWVVMEDGKEPIIVAAEKFRELYEPIPDQPSKFWYQKRYLGRLMFHSYIVQNGDSPVVQGTPGTYVVQELEPADPMNVEQRVVSVQDFEAEFLPVDSSISDMVAPAKVQLYSELPVDFNFTMYLSDVYAQAVVKLVTLEWPAWLCVQAFLLLVWSAHVLSTHNLAPVAGVGYIFMIAALVARRHVTYVEGMLSCRTALREKKTNKIAAPKFNRRHSITVHFHPGRDGEANDMSRSNRGKSFDSPAHRNGRVTPLGGDRRRSSGSNTSPVAHTAYVASNRPTVAVDNDTDDVEGFSEVEFVSPTALLSMPRAQQLDRVPASPAGCAVALPSSADSSPPVADAGGKYAAPTGFSGGVNPLSPTEAELQEESKDSFNDMAALVRRSKRGSGASSRRFDWDSYRVSVSGQVESARAGAGLFASGNKLKAAATKVATLIRQADEKSNEPAVHSTLVRQAFRAAVRKALVLSTISNVCSVLDKAPVDTLPRTYRGTCAVLCWRRRGLCRPRNKQEQLLWFGRRGVGFTRLLIQVIIIGISLFVATSTTLLVSSGGYCSKSAFAAPECAGWAAVMLIPTVVVLSVVPSTVSTFVLVTNVEDMANTDVARQVVHTQYLTHALQALRMLAVFALNAQSVVIPKTLVRPFSSMNFWTPGASDLVTPMHASPQGRPTLTGVQAPGNQHHTLLEAVPPSPAVQALQARLNASKDANLPRTAEEIYGDRESSTFIQRRQVVRTVFNLLDRNFKGFVSIRNMRQLMVDLGVHHVTEAHLLQMLEVLDRNNAGVIEFEEFFDFVAMHDRPTDAKRDRDTVTRYTFGLLDRAGKGYITVASLLRALSSLGAFVQVDELSRLMNTYGTDGRLKLRQFKKLVAEHNRFNTWVI